MGKSAIACFLLLGAALSAWPWFGSAQRRRSEEFPTMREEFRRPARGGKVHRGEYTFTRLRYSGGGYGYRGASWTTDYPKADEQFLIGLRNWVQSSLDISSDPTTAPPAVKELSKYPFIYAVEPGHMFLSGEDAAELREYLLRGGFLMLDDFWGSYEWANVQEQMRKVFPEYTIKDLPLDHTLFHCYFDINEIVQVPNVGNAYRGITYEQDGYVPYYMAITNEEGRVMVFIARNADNGDAWEWIDDPGYPLKYGLAAYRLGMNCIVYAMTH